MEARFGFHSFQTASVLEGSIELVPMALDRQKAMHRAEDAEHETKMGLHWAA